MQTVTITISGDYGSGKTTLAELIASVLHQAGISVDVRDDAPETAGSMEQRLQAMMPKVATGQLRIIVQTQQHRPVPNIRGLEGAEMVKKEWESLTTDLGGEG